MTYQEQRAEVIKYVQKSMQEQGASLMQAISATTAIFFFNSKDVQNLYKAINSGLEQQSIEAIVAHDFNGLANKEHCFLPKSSQFANVQ